MPTLRKLHELNNNQWASQFDLVFTEVPGTPAFDLDEMTIRASSLSFPFPETTHAVTELMYRGLKATFAAPLDETAKEFQVQILIDDNWVYYNMLRNWQRLVYDNETGQVGSRLDTITTMSAFLYGAGGNISKVFNFEGVQIRGLKPSDPDPASGEFMRAEANFIYMIMNERI